MNTPLITPELVVLDGDIGATKENVISHLCSLVATSGRAEESGLIEAVLAREAQTVTGMPGGIAIPHCRAAAVKIGSLAFARLPQPVDFGAKDGPADLVFLIAADENSGKSHLKLLQKLARNLVNPLFLESLRKAETSEAVVEIISAVVQDKPVEAAAGADTESAGKVSSANKVSDPAVSEKAPLIVAVTSCPTGIAHTYMAADSLINAGKKKGLEVQVEPQGSGAIARLSDETIKTAKAVIFANDVPVQMRERFAGLPLVQTEVKKAISNPEALLDLALERAADPRAPQVQMTTTAGNSSKSTGEAEAQMGWARRIQKAVMGGVSYMIPFVAAGGLLIALGFLVAGYDVAYVAQEVVLKYSFFDLPGKVMHNNVPVSSTGLPLYLGSLFTFLGQQGMGFLVAALAGYVAFGLAGRPGIAPGFIGGAVSVLIGAGFLGGLVAGIIAGLIATWLANLHFPRWLAGLMPVVIIPLLTTLLVGAIMIVLLGHPLARLLVLLQNALQSMSGSSAVILGMVIGLMMCFDLGGPVNKAAYLFGTAGLSAASLSNTAPYQVMAAVMISGMVPPLAMALSTVIRPSLYSESERENGKAAWLLGASFISEGAIPFAASDPFRVIPSMMVGGAISGGLSMLLGVGLKAPHGGIFVIFAVDSWWAMLLSLLIGTIVAALLVSVLKTIHQRKSESAVAPIN